MPAQALLPCTSHFHFNAVVILCVQIMLYAHTIQPIPDMHLHLISVYAGRQARDKLLSAIECMSSQLPSLEIQVIDHKGVLRLEQERISTIASQLRISKTASRELLNAVNWNVEDIKPSLVNTTSSVGT